MKFFSGFLLPLYFAYLSRHAGMQGRSRRIYTILRPAVLALMNLLS